MKGDHAWRTLAAGHDTMRSLSSTLPLAPDEERPALARFLFDELRHHHSLVQTLPRLVVDHDLRLALRAAHHLAGTKVAGPFERIRTVLDDALGRHIHLEEDRLRRSMLAE